MNQEKAKFTWHYYMMALGALLAMLGATLSSLGAVFTGLSIAIISHPKLNLSLPVRVVFYALFFALYVIAFPDPDVVREMMAK